MKTAGTQHFVERVYREGGDHQWAREVLVNAIEAGATKIEFGIEWQAVEAKGVYRRVIADNGRGMRPDELVDFFNTFGGGAKPIGGVHENFGVGSKTSLLPWNRYGLVVLSWCDGEPAMIWVCRDDESGEYGLRAFEIETASGTAFEEVVVPFVDLEHGVDWSAVKPEWINEHGTVLVLLGDDPTDDTVLGDPERVEYEIKGISAYLNRRVWDLPKRTEVVVDELRAQDRSNWPSSESVGHGPTTSGGPDQRTNARAIRGARHYIDYPDVAKGRLAAKGTEVLSDGARVHWFLWSGSRPAVGSYASLGGYVAALYRGELYDRSIHAATYRSFGIAEKAVRSKIWLVVEPRVIGGEGDAVLVGGVYPRTDRNGLLLHDGTTSGKSLPWADWAAEFADRMPDPLVQALRAARRGQSGTLDEEWRSRLADRFGSRWRIDKRQVSIAGDTTVAPEQAGAESDRDRNKKEKNGTTRAARGGGTKGAPTLGSMPGPQRAARKRVSGGIPHFREVGQEDVADGMLAAWQPNDHEHPEGVVLLNVEHVVLVSEIEHWQRRYADHHAEAIRREVIDTYGEIAVAKVAHSEHLKGVLTSSTVETELRSEAALTMGLLGLVGEEALLAPRIGGKFGRQRSADAV